MFARAACRECRYNTDKKLLPRATEWAVDKKIKEIYLGTIDGQRSNSGHGQSRDCAGSCGILPAVLATAAESLGAGEKAVVAGLFTAAGIGMIIEDNATTAGAKGGCQAECGSASCMADAAAVEIAGGTPRQSVNAGAIALKNLLGLVCDPVAGLVEIPCVKRNAIGAAVALLSADMALAGVESRIPLDEVIGAMREIGDALPSSLKETSLGGLANTPTARQIDQQLQHRS